MAKRHPITGCRADTLMGLWLMEFHVLQQLVAQALSHNLTELAQINLRMRENAQVVELEGDDDDDHSIVRKLPKGLAQIDITGPTTKFRTSFQSVMGGTSTVRVGDLLQQAALDDSVKAIVLRVDSPGGTYHGVSALMDRIQKVNKIKPVMVFGEDTFASAAMMYGTQGTKLVAAPGTDVGSIGVYTALMDTSGRFEKDGIKVHPIATSEYKSTGAAGTPITDKQLADVQRRVDSVYSSFVQAVSQGMGLSEDQVRKTEARVYPAHEAKELGLVHDVMHYDEFLDMVSSASRTTTGSGGTSKSTSKIAATSRSNKMELTQQQLDQIRRISGNAQMTSEEAVAWMLDGGLKLMEQGSNAPALQAQVKELNDTVTQLRASQPQQLSAEELTDRASLLQDKITLLEERGHITPHQRQELCDFVMKDGKINQFAVSRANGAFSLDPVLKALQANEPMKLGKTTTKVQTAPKNKPATDGGKTDDEDELDEVELTDKALDGLTSKWSPASTNV